MIETALTIVAAAISLIMLLSAVTIGFLYWLWSKKEK